MTAFSPLIPIDRSYQCAHCQLSLSLISAKSVIGPCDDPKMGIQSVNTTVSANSHSLRMPLAVDVCPFMVATQSCLWKPPSHSVSVSAVAGKDPHGPSVSMLHRSKHAAAASVVHAGRAAARAVEFGPAVRVSPSLSCQEAHRLHHCY